MVVQPVSRRALRHREHRVLLQLLRRDPAGVGVDGDDAGPARDRGLPQLRRRPARPAPRHPVQHRRRLDDLRRRRRDVDGENAKRGSSSPRRSSSPPQASCPRRLEPDIPGMDTFAGTSLFTSRWPRTRCRPHRQARRCHRHRLDRGAADPRGGQGRRAPHCVSAFARVHAAVEGPRLRAGRAGRDEGRTTARSAPRSASIRSGRRGCRPSR